MGLFSNNKKPCPICGNATPRLLPTKVEGVPICNECDKKIDLPNGVLDSMTLDDFRRYIDSYSKDQVLRERTEMNCVVADDADSCVAYGCGKSLAWMNHMQEGTINISRRRLLKE